MKDTDTLRENILFCTAGLQDSNGPRDHQHIEQKSAGDNAAEIRDHREELRATKLT
jgi:hypothetical protein